MMMCVVGRVGMRVYGSARHDGYLVTKSMVHDKKLHE